MSSTEMYMWCKAHGICVSCRREDAMIGHVRCFDCLEKEREHCKCYLESGDYKALKKTSQRAQSGGQKGKRSVHSVC